MEKNEYILKEIIKIAKKYYVSKVVLFGSRARETHTKLSDYDIAVYGINKKDAPNFIFDVEDIETLVKFDVVFIDNETSQALIDNIKKDGKIIMNELTDKFSQLKIAFERLKDVQVLFLKNKDDQICQDSIIKRFEICFELSWKALREFLIDQGINNINSPKAVFKEAFLTKLISDQYNYLAMITDRNTAVHIYNSEMAKSLAIKIVNDYIPLINSLIKTLEENN